MKKQKSVFLSLLAILALMLILSLDVMAEEPSSDDPAAGTPTSVIQEQQPGITDSPVSDTASTASVDGANIVYQTHVQNIGWQGEVSNGDVSGTTGKGYRLEGIRISVNGADMGVTYRTHVQDYGWQNNVSDGAVSGTVGKAKRLEAIQISLTGTQADQFDVYYRVHAQDYGWLGWAKNGESAGTAGYGYRLEAIQIQLVTKGGAAPGSTDQAFVQR